MLELGSGCKYRSSLAERSDCTETIINQLLADSYQHPISEWQVKTSSGLPETNSYREQHIVSQDGHWDDLILST